MSSRRIPEDLPRREEAFHASFLLSPDPVLEHALKASEDGGLPEIAVSPMQGKYLHLLVKGLGAKRILEVGTLGGYSSIWLARALPADGELVTLEFKPEHANVARSNIEHAGLSSKVKVLVGNAAETLKTLKPEFDFVFIDADSKSVAIYVQEAKRLLKKGGVVVVDNVVKDGAVSEPSITGQYITDQRNGIRKMLESLKGDQELDATTIQTVGAKCWDGFLFAVKA